MIKGAEKKKNLNTGSKEVSTSGGMGCKCCGSKELLKAGSKNGYELWECKGCDFIFINLSYAQMLEAYKSGYHSINDGAPQNGWAKSIDFLEPALRWLPVENLKIMDFGCGESCIPEVLRKQGHKVTAVDIVPPKNPHPDRLTGDILELDLPELSFDIVYSYQVFEHITEPARILKRLLSFLNTRGILLIHTDMETPERHADEFMNWWYVLPPDHCSYFRHKTFETMINRMGHRIIYKNPKVVMASK